MSEDTQVEPEGVEDADERESWLTEQVRLLTLEEGLL